MSGTIGGMVGMGSNGMGMGGDTSNIPPGLLRMLMAQQAAHGGGMGGAPMQNAAPQMPQMPQPPQGGNPMQQPQMPQAQPPQGMAQAMQGGGAQALLAQLAKGQQGVAPQPGINPPQQQRGPMPIGAPQQGVIPAWLHAMLHGQQGQQPPQPGMTMPGQY